jgi:hypothetical protein
VLENALKTNRDGRAAYGDMGKQVLSLLRRLRDLPIHCYMTAEQTHDNDDTYTANMPGNKVTNKLPHIFDEVFALRVAEQQGERVRFLQTANDGRFYVKDRSGALDAQEKADLAHIVSKIQAQSGSNVEGTQAKEVEADAQPLEYDREKDSRGAQQEHAEDLERQRKRFFALVSEVDADDGDAFRTYAKEAAKALTEVDSFNDIPLGHLQAACGKLAGADDKLSVVEGWASSAGMGPYDG